jgi:D-methionine transport system ATP-binding protein
MIQLVNVTKTFRAGREVQAVRNVSLTVEDGEIFGVIGFSGAGKSTLVRCVNLLERPDSGAVLIDGRDLTRLSEKELRAARKKIGMIFQHFNLFRSRTVGGNIAFSLQHSGLSKDAIDGRVRDLLKLVGLEDKEQSYPSQLSGGQKQRVGIARSLASNPSILLCDEATSALDPQTTNSILSLLKELNRKLGLTIIIITHEMRVIKSICGRAAVMESGAIVEEGSIFDLFANPQQKITRDFIATTSHLYKIYGLLAEDAPLTRLSAGQILARFSYQGRGTAEALISTASVRFGVSLNIIFGDIDIIADTPLGGLVIIMDGTADAKTQALAWFAEKGVRIEILKTGADADGGAA